MEYDPEKSFVINEHVKNEYFDLLKPQGATGEGKDREYEYSILALTELTHNLMHWLFIAYDDHRFTQPVRKLEDYSEEERLIYFPYAFVLACLSGNAFRTGHLNAIFENPNSDSKEMISQYIPDAERIIGANSGDLEELKQMSIKTVLINLVSQYPADKIIFRTLDGHPGRTGADMVREISVGSPMGREYSSKVLQIAADLLARQANRE